MGDNSCLRGHGFKSQCRILDALICWKNCIVCLKRLKINVKEAGVGPLSMEELRILLRFTIKTGSDQKNLYKNCYLFNLLKLWQ